MGDYVAQLGGARILNATRVDQSGADDTNVIDWTKTNDFILAVNIYSDPGKDTVAAQYKLKWRALPSGTFTDMVSTGAINYSADTSLVDGAAIAVGGRKCSTQGYTWQAGEEVEGSINSDSIDLAEDYETEIHFALDCSGAADGMEYEFELWDDTKEATRGLCGATIKMEAGAVTRELVTTISVTTSTSASGLDILRELVSTIPITTLSSTSDINVLRELTATAAATTLTSTPSMLVLRELVATIPTTASSAANLYILRELAASITTTTLLSDIDLVTAGLIELATTIATTTTTSTAAMNVVRPITATISTTSSTTDVALVIVRALDAQIATGTSVSDASVLVLRELSTTVSTTTLTSAIELLTDIVGNPIWYYEMLKRRNR